jgi:hypothetical protein
MVEPHRHEGVFVARGKEDALVTLNLVPGSEVYGEKRISVEVSVLSLNKITNEWTHDEKRRGQKSGPCFLMKRITTFREGALTRLKSLLSRSSLAVNGFKNIFAYLKCSRQNKFATFLHSC